MEVCNSFTVNQPVYFTVLHHEAGYSMDLNFTDPSFEEGAATKAISQYTILSV